MKLTDPIKRKIDFYFDNLKDSEIPDLLDKYGIVEHVPKKFVLVFEGAHGVGKSTLLKELHNPSKGVINLYQSDIWDKTNLSNNKRTVSQHYNDQFVSSLKSQIYFIETLLNTKDINVILIDRWFLTSLYQSIKNERYKDDFNNKHELINYVKVLSDYVDTFADLHTFVFQGTDEVLDISYYDYEENKNEMNWVFNNQEILNNLYTKDNIHKIVVENINGSFDIKDKFFKFAEQIK